MNMIAAAIGRILLALIFIVSGASKLFDPAGTLLAVYESFRGESKTSVVLPPPSGR